jgi:hypothetical protein
LCISLQAKTLTPGTWSNPAGSVEKQIGGMLCNLINMLSGPVEEDELQEVQDQIDKVG